ncbi:MAG: large conductance mechanosensitive channel protein MscL [Clostridia bacterium]|nr:large conductance mechanosensitive channel protein MscL [Clostridia bacterium]MBP5592632.1 large conductance mechanosensitive channel protein MscL [Clostridia bacterium]
MKKFFKDFKAFITRGNILDMAVGVIIGGAFSAIVTAFTNGIIMPLVNYVLSLNGENGMETAYTFLKEVYTDGSIDLAKSIYIDWGAFITAILNFLIIAMTLFIIIRAAMKSAQMFNRTKASIADGKLTKEEKAEMKEKGLNYKDKAAVDAYREEKAKLAEEAAAKEAAEKEAERLANPTEADLLKEIRDLLKEKA